MFGRKKEEKPPRRKAGDQIMAQMGLTNDFENMEAMIYGDGDDDDELEAELARIQGRDPPPKKKSSQPKAGPIDWAALDRMANTNIDDIPDDDLDDDIDDPSLQAELAMLTQGDEEDRPPSPKKSATVSSADQVGLIESRLQNYTSARDNAKANNDSSKVRRLERGIKTLQDLHKKAKVGKPVAEDDIPPEVAVSASVPHPEPTRPAPPPPSTRPIQPSEPLQPLVSLPSQPSGPASAEPSGDNDQKTMLIGRRDQYKMAALQAKRSGDDETARKYIKISKQFDHVIGALDDGKPIDLSKMPPPPPNVKQSGGQVSSGRKLEENRTQGASAAAGQVRRPADTELSWEKEVPEVTSEDAAKAFNAPPPPSSVLEALEQRMEKYKTTAAQAKADANGSKARRMDRIVKQYVDAIKSHKAGKPVNYEELPSPPGFAPIPVNASESKPKEQARPAPAPHPAKSPSQNNLPPPPQKPQARTPSPKKPESLKRSPSTRIDQQVAFLTERQHQFKVAALEAKKNGDMELAKKYLRMSKGFDPMIDAAKSGLPVDMSQIPKPPGANEEEGFTLVEAAEDAGEVLSGDREEMYKKLEQDLLQQIRTANANAEHFTQIGDISSASKFDKLAESARKDLDSLKNAYKHGDPVPRFHYETRQFSLIQCCTDLGDNDLEIQIVRGLNYGLPSDYAPKDLDTYVKYDFPYPNDAPQKGDSETCRSTNSPEYNQTFKLQINRKSRGFLRILKSKSIKFEIYYKRGFFKSDKLLGTVNVKLQPLESKCVVHDSYDLMDGRKTVGGKLEVKIRIRDPFVSKQVEEVKEKWLVIDRFERNLAPPASKARSRSKSPSRPEGKKSSKICEIS